MTSFDPSHDFAAVADGLETVTVLRRDASETVVPHALRRAATTAEGTVHNRYNSEKQAPSGGGYLAADVTWHLPCGELPGAPAPGDILVDADRRRWTVLEVQRATFGARWKCAARNVALAYGLAEVITLLRAVGAKGSGGAAEPAWEVWKSGIPARIQPYATDMTTVGAARAALTRYQVFLAENVSLDPSHRIEGADGTVYRILGSSGAERIGELQTLDVEVVR